MSISVDRLLTDEALIQQLPNFTNEYAQVNGVNLHYVQGGQGKPLFLLPGWPETWWAYHKVMPLLAAHYQVIAVDIRGMGSSDKPQTGYEKKNMANDIAGLIEQLGYQQVYLAGHDIGAHVAYSVAANHPQFVAKLALLDTPHPDPGMYQLPMLPPLGSQTAQVGTHPYPWWLAFNQVKELPEQLLVGRMSFVLDWVFRYLSVDQTCIDAFDRAVYQAGYDSANGIRACNAWYQAFPQDIEDSKAYGKLTMPVLGIGGSGYQMLAHALSTQASSLALAKVENSGHFILEEKPQEIAALLRHFLN